MEDYIVKLRAKFYYPTPKKPQHSPHRHTPINYGAKTQYATKTPNSPSLNKYDKLRIKQLIGSIKYYAQAVENNLLVGRSKLDQQQSSPTEDRKTDMLQLLDCLATYLDDGITYYASDLLLAGHVYDAYLNASKTRSRAVAHIIIFEDLPVSPHNGPVPQWLKSSRTSCHPQSKL